MGKYIRHEKMTTQQIQSEIDFEFREWNEIACSGCQDPGFLDGVNMNLIRNHIIYWYRLMDKKKVAETQISLFDSQTPEPPRRSVPPEVSNQYMVAGCKYSDRLDGKYGQPLVWGTKGESQA